MNQTANKPIKTLVLASLLSLAGTFLFYDCLWKGAPLGANVPVFFVLFYAALCVLCRGKINLLRHQNYLLLLLGFGFSLTFALYNNAFLLFLNALALLFCTLLQINLMLELETFPPFSLGSISNACFTLFVRPFHRIGKALSPEKSQRKALFPILMAILILIPVMGLLLSLLASADQVFAELLGRIFRIDSLVDLLLWVLIFVAGGMLLASLLTSLLTERQQPPAVKQKTPAKFNLLATSIVLAGVCLLMVVFALVQGIFLFGSAQLPSGLTYSEYARQGFFQLCAAAIFVFALVCLCRTCTRHAEGAQKNLLGALYTLLLLCTILLSVSSFYRLMLYERAFSYTQLRIYVQAFLILLSLICAGGIVHIWLPWQGVRQWVALLSLACLLALSCFNVDAFIARENTKRLDKTMEAYGEYGDLDYLLNLSADALPYYIDAIEMDDLAPEPEPDWNLNSSDEDYGYWSRNSLRYKRCLRLRALIQQIERGNSDLRFWNLGRQVSPEKLSNLKQMVEQALSQHSSR